MSFPRSTLIIMNLFNLCTLIKNNCQLILNLTFSIFLFASLLNLSTTDQIHLANLQSLIKSIDLLLKNCRNNFSPSLINNFNIHKLPLAFLIIPNSFIIFFQNPDLNSPISFNALKQPFNRYISPRRIHQFMILNPRYILFNNFKRNLHPSLNLKAFGNFLATTLRFNNEILRTSYPRLYIFINNLDKINHNKDRK